MNEMCLTNEELMTKFDQSIKECKLLQMYLLDVNDDYAKKKIANLKFEFACHRYLQLLREVKSRGLQVNEEYKYISKLLFN